MNYKFIVIYFVCYIYSAVISGASYFAPMSATKIVIHTIPKSGTHLLGKAVELLTGKTACYDIRKVNWVKNYYPAHELRLIPRRIRYKIMTILRDPRDRFASFINTLERQGKRKTINKDLDQVISEILQNLGSGFYLNYGLLEYRSMATLDQYYQRQIPTYNFKNACRVHFERLVGLQGGGSLADQQEEIIKIAQFLEIPLDQTKLEHVINNLFGGTLTFMQGQIGRWKTFFSEKNKELLKKSLGDWLIKLGYDTDHNW